MTTDPRSCSALTRQAGVPLAGTAPLARTWLVLEQPGPYGRKALHDSHLPRQVGEALAAATGPTPVTVVLARSAGRHHADVQNRPAHRFWIAHVAPGGARMRSGVVADLADLLGGDLADVMERAGRGELPAWGTRTTEPVLLVCTNGRRDVCCALSGRPVAGELAADPRYAGQVMEVSHLGGHRFAPTALLLPTGMAYGRLTADAARAAIDAAREDRVALDAARGLSALSRPMQAADLAVRAHAEVRRTADIELLRRSPVGKLAHAALGWDGDGADTVDVVARHDDGRCWLVPLTRTWGGASTPASCGKEPATASWWDAGDPQPLPAWR
ncbi:MAG TPA: sucrase ferredoxin [Candidatus Nanopelagicales bacterium]|nr:sucrase ferredoxin [Candidatus Nanopelagicales bacterium]